MSTSTIAENNRLMGPADLEKIYPEHSTPWAIYRRVVDFLLAGVIREASDANEVLQLGEPAVYGALRELAGPVGAASVEVTA